MKKRGEREEGKRKEESDNEKPGKAGPTSQKVVGVRKGSTNVIVVNRSSTVRALRCSSIVCFSVKDGVHFSTFCDSMAILVSSRAECSNNTRLLAARLQSRMPYAALSGEGLPKARALSRLAFRGHKLRPPQSIR